MAKKSFEDLIEEDNVVGNPSESPEVTVVEPVTAEHPMVSELVRIADDDKFKQKVADITNLIGGLEVGKVLLQEASKDAQKLTDTLRDASLRFGTNVASARVQVENFTRQVDEVRSLRLNVKLTDAQQKWLHENRMEYVKSTDKAFAAHLNDLQKLSVELVKKFKDEIEGNTPYCVISERILVTFISLFFVLVLGFVFSVLFNVFEVHATQFTWILWIEGGMIALIVGLVLYFKRKQSKQKYN